ncbi:MAG: metal-dependent hydrolase, partial [Akkermansiaceae bacterium]
MDSITQAALGGLCGEITLRKQLGWKGMAWGIFFGTLPDLDILAYPWLDATERLGWHRGLSHSILLMALASLFFGWLLSKLHQKKGVTFKRATLFVFITWATHVLIDCFTSYGTQVLEPFSSYRASLNNMSIIDISFTLPMLFALLLVLFFNRESDKRTWIGRAAALWLCLYTAASFAIKHQANQHFEKQLVERGIKPNRMMTAPTISNIFLWRMIADTEDHYHVAYWSPFDNDDRPTEISQLPKGHEHLKNFTHFPETKTLKWFAKDWHMIIPDEQNPGTVLFIDMRFTEMITPDAKRPVFVWRLETDPDDAQHLKFSPVSFRGDAPPAETLDYLWQRIQGGAIDWMSAPWPWEKPPNTN